MNFCKKKTEKNEIKMNLTINFNEIDVNRVWIEINYRQLVRWLGQCLWFLVSSFSGWYSL